MAKKDVITGREDTPTPILRSRSAWSTYAAVFRAGAALLFVMASLAAGHLLMVAVNAADAAVSAEQYQSMGIVARWFGDGPLDAELSELGSVAIGGGTAVPTIHMLPVSPFLVAAALGLTALGFCILLFSRFIADDGLQSLLGVLGGLFLWTGAVEYGLVVASRLLGIAKGLSMHGDQVIGVAGEYVLLKHTWGILLILCVYLTFAESNRCNVFLWLRRRVPLMRGPLASGHITNYGPRTAFQYIMIIWTFYVLLLWLYDETLFGAQSLATRLVMVGSLAGAVFLTWRTVRRPTWGHTLRYAIGTAVVAWTPIEISAKWGLFEEPWLILNPQTAVLFFGGLCASGVLVAREILRQRAASKMADSRGVVFGGVS